MNDFNEYINQLIDLVIEHEDAALCVLNTKLSEEVGELSEQVLVQSGYCLHKADQLTEELWFEASDVVNCALAIAIKHMYNNLNMSKQEIKVELNEALFVKLLKYRSKIGDCGGDTGLIDSDILLNHNTVKMVVAMLQPIKHVVNETIVLNAIETVALGINDQTLLHFVYNTKNEHAGPKIDLEFFLNKVKEA